MQLGVQLSMQVSSQSTEPVPGKHCGSESGRVFERRYGYWPHGMGVPCACAYGMDQPWPMGMGIAKTAHSMAWCRYACYSSRLVSSLPSEHLLNMFVFNELKSKKQNDGKSKCRPAHQMLHACVYVYQ